MRVAVVGATGAVGRDLCRLLERREFPCDDLVPLASERSVGRQVSFRGRPVTVRALAEPDAFDGVELALFSAGAGVSREHAPRAVAAGAKVVDNSSAWRMDPEVPLVVPEVNAAALKSIPKGIVANPNCSTMQMVVALKPILDAAGIERIVVSTYQSVSGTGQKAVEELRDQAHAILHEQPASASVYPHQIAFNVLPQVEKFKDGDDYTTEERKMMAETRKILGREDIGISATCARVPVYVGHSESVNVQTRDSLSPEDCRELLSGAPGVTVIDDPGDGMYPLATDAAGRDDVLVGRIRRDTSHERCLNLWVVGDNLRKGAATNAVQIAERLFASPTGSRPPGSPLPGARAVTR